MVAGPVEASNDSALASEPLPPAHTSATGSDTRLTAGLIVSQAWTLAGAFAINVLAARALGPAARGELALYLQICYSVNLVALLGRNRSFLVTSARGTRLAAALHEMELLSRVPLMLAAAVAVVVGAAAAGLTLTTALLAAALWTKMAGGVLANTHRASAIVAGRGGAYLRATVSSQCLLVGSGAVLLFARLDSVEGWLAVYGMTALIPYFISSLVVRRRDRAAGRNYRELAETRSVGLRLLPTALSDALLTRVDRYLLPLLSSFEQLGVYAVVSTITELVNWPLKQYLDARAPLWASQAAQGTLHPWLILRTTLLYAFGMSIPVATVAMVGLVPVFGASYQDGVQLVIPLTAASVLYAIGSLGVAIATAAHRARLAWWVSSSGSLVALPLYFVLIGSYGAMGAAIGSVAGYGVSAAISIWAIGSLARTPRSDEL